MNLQITENISINSLSSFIKRVEYLKYFNFSFQKKNNIALIKNNPLQRILKSFIKRKISIISYIQIIQIVKNNTLQMILCFEWLRKMTFDI